MLRVVLSTLETRASKTNRVCVQNIYRSARAKKEAEVGEVEVSERRLLFYLESLGNVNA